VFSRGPCSPVARVLPWPVFFRGLEGPDHDVARPQRNQPTDHLPAGVYQGANDFTVLQECECFVGECRESGESTQHADQEKRAFGRTQDESLPGGPHDDAACETTQDVHDKRAVGKKRGRQALDRRR